MQRIHFGVGAQVNIKTKSGVQTWQNYNSRGFESCIEPNLDFWFGKRYRGRIS